MKHPVMKLLPPAAALSAALLLAGCAGTGSLREQASLTQPQHVASSQTLGKGQGNWPASDWALGLGGKPLVQLIDEALRDNPGWQAAAARVRAAQSVAEVTRASQMPQVGAQVGATRQLYTGHGLVPPPLAGSWQTDAQAVLNLSWDLDLWGRHAAEWRSVLAQAQALQAEHQASRLLLSSSIARAWVQLARQEAQQKLIREQLDVREQWLHLAQLRQQVGMDADVEVEQARSQLALLRVEEAQWQEAMQTTRLQLAALLGKGPDRGLQIEAGELPAPAQVELPSNMASDLLARRPDILAARWRVESALGEVEVARAQFYPSVNLNAFIGYSSLGLSRLLESGSAVRGAGPVLRLPIFEGGALRANLSGRQAQADAAIYSYNQTLVDALREVADQAGSLRAAQLQATQLDAASKAAERAWTLAQSREQRGLTNRLPVLANRLSLLAQKRAEIDLLARRADLRIGLVKALGGGLEASSPAAASTEHQASSQATEQKPTQKRAS